MKKKKNMGANAVLKVRYENNTTADPLTGYKKSFFIFIFYFFI